MDADTSKKKEQTNVADNTSPEGGGGEAVTAVKTSTSAQDDAATKNKTRTSTSTSTTAVTTAKMTKKKRSTTSTTKFYAIRKNDCLKAPAIFVDWEDCSFYLDSQEGVEAGEYKEFDRLMDACEYIEEYLQPEQKKRSSSISSAAAKKRKSESSAAGSAAKKRKSTPLSSGSASRKKAPPASATAAAASALALLKGPKQSLGDDDDDDVDEEEATKKGPRKRTKKAQEKWDQMLQMLPKFGEKYDHYDVQQEKQDPQFSNLAESTGLLKKEIDCYLLDPETSRLTSKEYKLLHSIGYIQAMRLTLPFHRKSALLNRYFLENGTFKVDSTDQTIYNFAKDIADACRKIMAGESQPGTSTAAPAAAAAAASAAPTETQQQQADGEEAAANTRVTFAAGDGNGDSDTKQQKVVRIGAQKGWKGPLTQLQYEHLESIGFIQWLEQNPNEYTSRDKRGSWSRKRKGRSEEQQTEWDELLDLLPKFHSKYGHYDLLKSIITKDDEFPDHLIKSGMELKTEVEKYEKNPSCSLLSPMEYRLLDAIGYIKSWKMSLRFDRKTKLWKDYFVEHGTFRVTSTTKNRMIYEFAKAVTDECKKIMAGESNTVTAEEARAAKANRKKAASSSPDDEEEEEQQDEQGETGETNPAASSSSKKNADKKWSDKNWFDGHLTQLQYQQLESIGLVRWLQLNPNEKTIMKQHDTKYHDRWEQNYEKLHAFYKVNGRHPKKAEDSALHSWIHRQKRLVHQSITESEGSQKQQSHGIIFTSKQIGKLSMVGISFQVRKSKGMEERAQEWFDYVREHNGKHPLANIPIGKWAMDQRKKYQVWKETGNPGNLTQEYVDRLAAGGFPWVLKRGRGSTSRQQESYNLDEW